MDGSEQPRTQFPFVPVSVVEQLRTATAPRANRAEVDDFTTRFPEHREALNRELDFTANPSSFGPYDVLEVLGRGGMGIVYRARERSTAREYALKVLARDWRSEPEAVERFRREGRLTGALAHPRCVLVHAADFEQDLPFIAMELVRGRDLQALIDSGETISVERAIALTLDVADGLVHAHRLGIVHRDVKPSNCFVDHEGRGKIGDFGLSRLISEAPGALTSQGFVGTYVYAAPEQVARSFTDARSDVYSTGALLYALLTGAPPFTAPTRELLVAKILRDPLTPASRLRRGVPPGLDAVLEKALARESTKRFQTMAEFREALVMLRVSQRERPSAAVRLCACSVDAVLVWLGLALVTWRPALSFAPQTIAVSVFGYYVLAVALFGRTLGMSVLRIGVTHARVFQCPGLFGAVVFAILPAAVNVILYEWLAGNPQVALWLPFLGLSLFLPNGWRPSELLSHTRLVSTTTVRDAPPPATRRTVSRGDAHRLGPFVIPSDVDLSTSRVTLGLDPRIERVVWLALRLAATESTVSEQRRAVARATRLRWIASGIEGECAWDAFSAPDVVPLDAVLRGEASWARVPMEWLSWPRLRTLLLDLIEELEASCREGTLPSELHLDKLRVSEDGHMVLWDLEGPGTHFSPDPGEAAATAFVAFVVAELTSRRIDQQPRCGPMPVHATMVCARLAGQSRPRCKSLAEMAKVLRQTAALPTRADLPTRFAVASVILVGVVGVPIATSFVERVWDLRRDLQAVEALERAAAMVAADLREHPQWKDSVRSRRSPHLVMESEDSKHRKWMGPIARKGAEGGIRSLDVDPRPPRIANLQRVAGAVRERIVSFERGAALLLPSRWTRNDLSNEEAEDLAEGLAWSAKPVSEDNLGRASFLTGSRLVLRLWTGEEGARGEAMPRWLFLGLVLLSPFWVRFLGLAVVDRTGQLASRRTRLGRWVLAWSLPALACLVLVGSWPHLWWVGGPLAIGWLYLLFRRWRPDRPQALHDEALDVWVVPR